MPTRRRRNLGTVAALGAATLLTAGMVWPDSGMASSRLARAANPWQRPGTVRTRPFITHRPTFRPSPPVVTPPVTSPPVTSPPVTGPPVSTGTEGTDRPSWRLTFHDEFDGAAGARPGKPWVFDLGGEPNWGNGEWEYYTDRPENVFTDGAGHLAITARNGVHDIPAMRNCRYGSCDITSGRITTEGTFSQQYGRMEARIQVPAGQGMWPAFWMLGDQDGTAEWPASGEIDVMEVTGGNPTVVEGTGWGANFPEHGLGGDYMLRSGSFAAGFHVFAVEWSRDRIVWSVDGHDYFTLRRTDLKGSQQWAFDRKFHLLLNLAVGGEMPGDPDHDPDRPGSSTRYPATMLVDYVRVYQKSS